MQLAGFFRVKSAYIDKNSDLRSKFGLGTVYIQQDGCLMLLIIASCLDTYAFGL